MADEIFYTSRGAGATVLCLHGLWSSSSGFDGVEITNDLFRICAWDAPGYGRSPDAPDHADLDWFAGQAATAVEAAGDSPAHIVGSGWGALIAMQIALSRPHLVKSLVLTGAGVGLARDQLAAESLRKKISRFIDDPAGFADEASAELVSAEAPVSTLAAVRQVIESDVRAAGCSVAMETVVTSHLTTQLRALRIPTIVVWGDDDQILSLEDSQAVAEPIADSVVITCAGAGHLCHVDQPASFSIWLDSFLRIVDNVRELA